MSQPAADASGEDKPAFSPPSSILIVGAGVFGLSTALALARRQSVWANTTITVLERSPVHPTPDAASVDSSRIVRSDYADLAYSALAAEAQREWRRAGEGELGGAGRYTEGGLVLVADVRDTNNQQDGGSVDGRALETDKNGSGHDGIAPPRKTGLKYVWQSYENIVAMQESFPRARVLPDQAAIASELGTGGSYGDWGYSNPHSGWADAAGSMRWLESAVRATGRVSIITGTATSLLHEHYRRGETNSCEGRVTGVRLDSGARIMADLVLVAAGAWSGALVDLRDRAAASAQALAYMPLEPDEYARAKASPVVLNLSTGYFAILPPCGPNMVKIARHAYGYANPTMISTPLSSPSSCCRPRRAEGDNNDFVTVSLPPLDRTASTPLPIPAADEAGLRDALAAILGLPALRDRPFASTRLCWYSDTATGDWLIDYHPRWQGLVVATGDSGHAFKFLPVLGDKIADVIEGRCDEAFSTRWSWEAHAKADLDTAAPPERWAITTDDGSRGGEPGLVLPKSVLTASSK